MTPGLFAAVVIWAVLSACSTPPASPTTQAGAQGRRAETESLRVGGATVQIRLAMTNEDRRRGLGGVTSLPRDTGMLFVYAEPWLPDYWMKDCLMALDIAFIGDDGTILQVETLAPPTQGTRDEDIASTQAPEPCRLVLEMAGGWFARRGVVAGDRVIGLSKLRLSQAEARK